MYLLRNTHFAFSNIKMHFHINKYKMKRSEIFENLSIVYVQTNMKGNIVTWTVLSRSMDIHFQLTPPLCTVKRHCGKVPDI